MNKIAYIEVFENQGGNITIHDIYAEMAVEIDECMAEKLCRAILNTAKQIREGK